MSLGIYLELIQALLRACLSLHVLTVLRCKKCCKAGTYKRKGLNTTSTYKKERETLCDITKVVCTCYLKL